MEPDRCSTRLPTELDCSFGLHHICSSLNCSTQDFICAGRTSVTFARKASRATPPSSSLAIMFLLITHLKKSRAPCHLSRGDCERAKRQILVCAGRDCNASAGLCAKPGRCGEDGSVLVKA